MPPNHIMPYKDCVLPIIQLLKMESGYSGRTVHLTLTQGSRRNHSPGRFLPNPGPQQYVYTYICVPMSMYINNKQTCTYGWINTYHIKHTIISIVFGRGMGCMCECLECKDVVGVWVGVGGCLITDQI